MTQLEHVFVGLLKSGLGQPQERILDYFIVRIAQYAIQQRKIKLALGIVCLVFCPKFMVTLHKIQRFYALIIVRIPLIPALLVHQYFEYSFKRK
jgi:hypothetical protein